MTDGCLRRWFLLAVAAVPVAVGVGGAQAAGGALKPTFVSGGTVRTSSDVKSEDHALGMAVQADGKIIVAGYSDVRGSLDFALVRYTAAGKLDTTFGSGGKVLTDLGVKRRDFASAVAIQADGRIVAAGSTAVARGKGSDFALVRYTSVGELDTSFGSGGKVLSDLAAKSEDFVSAMAIQADGRIVAAGSSAASGGNNTFALARYMPDGTLDASFGTGGRVLTRLPDGGYDSASDVAVQSDGKIVAVGCRWCWVQGDFALVRYTPGGKLDPSFGTGGKVLTPVTVDESATASAVAVQRDRKIVAAGSIFNGFYSNFALLRFTAGGKLDASFGSGGKVLAHFSADQSASGVTLQKDGKIIAAGEAGPRNGPSGIAVVRYTAVGTVDPAFGTGGKVLTHLGAKCVAAASAVAVQKDGKIVVAGDRETPSEGGSFTSDFALVRYTPSGQLDASFGSGGKVLTDFTISHG